MLRMMKKNFLVSLLLLCGALLNATKGLAMPDGGADTVQVREPARHDVAPGAETLALFNTQPLEAANDSLMIGAKTTISCLFLGNSLTYHEVVSEEPAPGKRGLASTRVDRDYVHVLLRMIARGHHVNIKYSILNIAQFERTFSEKSFSMDELAQAENRQPDFLFVQIGENVSLDKVIEARKYEEEYVKLLNLFPHAVKFITLPFWPDKLKQYVATNVAIRTRSHLVDLSHLGDGGDPMNFAMSHKEYKMPGVGHHPGDYGMANIARCFYAAFNAAYGQN